MNDLRIKVITFYYVMNISQSFDFYECLGLIFCGCECLKNCRMKLDICFEVVLFLSKNHV